MRVTIATLLLLTATQAAALDYQEENMRQTSCKFQGEESAVSFETKQAGEPMFEITPEMGGAMYAMTKWSLEYGYNQATSKKDAFMASWSKCMDNWEYLMFYKKDKGVPAMQLHY